MPNQKIFIRPRMDGQSSRATKKIMLFGGDIDTKKRLQETLVKSEQYQRTEIRHPQQYAQEIYQAIKKENFHPDVLKSDHFFKNIDPHLKNDDLWNDIREIIKTNGRFDFSEIYNMNPKEWEIHPKLTTSESAIRYLEEMREFYLKKPLEQRIELLMLEVIKQRSDIACWVVLDQKKETEEKTTQGMSNTVSDFTLRYLYHEKDNIKAELVFWREGKRVPAPWENNPELWENCQKNMISELPEFDFPQRYNVFLYGFYAARQEFYSTHQDIWPKGEILSIDNYIKAIQLMFEDYKYTSKEKKAAILENWFSHIETRYKNGPFWPSYCQTSESREKFKVKNIYATAFESGERKNRSSEFNYLMIKRGRKIGLASAEKQNTLILFLLDGLDLKKVVNKKKANVHDITASELRYVYRNWSILKDKIVFARGNQFVPAPWEEKPKLWKRYRPKSRCSKNVQEDPSAIRATHDTKNLKELVVPAVCAATKQKKEEKKKNNGLRNLIVCCR